MKRNQTLPLGDVLRQFLKEQNLEQPLNERQIIAAWEEVLGKTTANYTTELSIKNRVLYAQISSAALRHELFLSRHEIKNKLNKQVGTNVITEIILK